MTNCYTLGQERCLTVHSGTGTSGELLKNTWKAIFSDMGRWKVGARCVVVLCFALLIILLVQILPQVDLLDTAFQRGTAPVVVHARTSGSIVLREFAALLDFPFSSSVPAGRSTPSECSPKASRNFPVLHHVFRC